MNEVAASVQSVTKGVASSNVYMRNQPSTSGKVLDRVYKGDSVQILARSGWYKIKTSEGKKGYASSKYINQSNGSSNNSGSNSGNSGSTAPSASASVEK